MAARTVQRHDQFRAVKHCMLKILVERDGIVRAGIHTELAEHARTEVVFVLNQYPENRSTLKLSDRFRGTLTMPHNDKNEHRCVACGFPDIVR